MDSLFGRLRQGAGKVAFEADKLRRQTALQGDINRLRKDEEKQLLSLGKATVASHEAGQLAVEELKKMSQEIITIRTGIAELQAQIEQIREEQIVVEPAAPQYGRICPNGHGQIAPEHNFCQECGARPVERPAPAIVRCSHCQAQLEPGSSFCSECGQSQDPPHIAEKQREPEQPGAVDHAEPARPEEAKPPPTQPQNCPVCQREREQGTQFCSQCGFHYSSESGEG